MKTRIFLFMGLCVVAFGFGAFPARAHGLVTAESAMGQGNTAALTGTLTVLQGTLDELRGKIAARAVAEPEKISGTLGAIRGNLLAIHGTIAALDARASRIASDETPVSAVALGPTTVVGTGMSYDGIPAAPKASEAETSLTSDFGTASVMNLGKRVWPVALIVLALTVPFLFKKKDDEPSVVMRTVEAPSMQEFEAPIVPATRRIV